jgi:hypothetical protein
MKVLNSRQIKDLNIWLMKLKDFCMEISSVLDGKNYDRVTNDQLRGASFSIS